MKKCVKISFSGEFSADFLYTFIQKNAKNLSLEGTAQVVEPAQCKIIVCGDKEAIDLFVDLLHKGSATASLEDIEIEPFLTDKDYRNVFRVIE